MSSSSSQVREIAKCRVCGNSGLAEILSLGEQFVSNFVDEKATGLLKAPLELVLCDPRSNGCGLLQSRHTVSPTEMYKQYWYRSGINRSMQEALADVASRAIQYAPLSKNDLVLDIGCNDGTLLRSYPATGIRTVGFDPAENLLEYSKKGTTRIFTDFFNFKAFDAAFPGEKAKIITSIAMFYDLDRPNEFVSDIVQSLDQKGVWIIQMSYLPLMLEKNAFDNICHEHLEYYSLFSLENLLKRHKLKVIDVETNDVNGGSFRIFIGHEKSADQLAIAGSVDRVTEMRRFEDRFRLNDRRTYDEFARRVEALKEKAVSFIRTEVSKGKKVFVYGASTKGNVLLQYYGLDHSVISAAVERNPDKYGLKTVGTKIPIISEADGRQQKPDYFFMLPWHFLPEFLHREKEFLDKGGKFIVPLPEFDVIDAKKASQLRGENRK